MDTVVTSVIAVLSDYKDYMNCAARKANLVKAIERNGYS